MIRKTMGAVAAVAVLGGLALAQPASASCRTELGDYYESYNGSPTDPGSVRYRIDGALLFFQCGVGERPDTGTSCRSDLGSYYENYNGTGSEPDRARYRVDGALRFYNCVVG